LADGFGRCCSLDLGGDGHGRAVPEALMEALMACAVPKLIR
jgi:DUF917 family protein